MTIAELEYRFSRLPRIQRTRFVVADGSIFTTSTDPLDYLMQHGVETPQGRIVGFVREGVGYADPLSQSIHDRVSDLIDEGIRQGGLQAILDVECDMV